MSQAKRKLDRVLAFALSLLMIFGMMPINSVYALEHKRSVLETNIGDIEFVVNEATEFTVTSIANDDANAMVKGYFDFSNPSAIEKLEYYETTEGYEGWYELTGEFGPSTGFPIIDGTSKFRVTFNAVGEYSVSIALKHVNDESIVYCSTAANVKVNRNASVLTTDIASKNFVVYEATEFTFTSVANDDADKLVKGYFDFSDPSAIEKLEYYETAEGMQGWYELNGAFGPATGFPVINGTSKFRVTFNKVGDYTVEVSLKQVSDDAVLSKVKANVSVAKTNITDITISPTSNKYTGEQFALATLNGEIKSGDIVTYTIKGDANSYAAIPNASAVGNYEVTITVDRGSNYNVYSQTVTSSIELGELELGAIKVQGLEGVYTGVAQNAVSVTGQGDYSLQYKLGNDDWSDTIPTVTDAGSYTVQVKATKTNYNDKEVSVDKAESAVYPFNVYIAKAEQKDFAFSNKTPSPLAYKGTFENKADGGQSGGTITYEVVDGNEYVSVDQNGKITALKAGGNATIKATRAGNNNYNAVSDTYAISTIKADQTDFAFEKAEYTVQYGTEKLTVVAKGGQSNGAVTYEVLNGDIGTIASADNKGNITFVSGKKGEMTIKATLAGGENYNDISAEVNVKVLTNDFSDKVSVDTCPTTGWYTETVSITPAAGYKISTSAQFDAEWKDSITVATEGKNSPDDVFLLEEATGYISEAISIDDIYIDKTNPTGLKITYSNSIRDVILETISFGFYNSEMTVTLEATDIVSKIDHFVYKIGNGAEVTVNKADIAFSGTDNEKATASFNIPANLSRSKITLTAFDTAGRSTTIVGDKTLVVDDVKPVVSVSYDNNDDSHNSYFKKFDANKPTRTATITIAEENFFIDDLYKEVYINDADGNPVAQGYNYLTITVGKRLNNEADYTYTDIKPVFTKDGDVYKATVEFVEDADYTFDVVFYDYSMNKNTSVDYGTSVAPTAFTVDNIAPVLDIEYDDTNATESQDNAGYYTGKRVATFKVTEHNFDPSELVFTVFGGSDVQNNTVNATQMAAFMDVLKDIANWSQNGDEYTATIEFDADANYAIELNYSDLADNAAEKETSSFCLDNTKPYVVTDAEISYSASILDTILNAITFGFYDAEMEVTITAYDETAGIDFFTYSYTVNYSNDKVGHEDEVGHKNDAGKKDVVIPHDKITFAEDGKKATASFKIPEQFRGYVSFTATDKSGKTSELFTDDKCIVVDNVAPGVNVTYDNNEVQNGNYYKANRTATISISADNFFADYLYTPIMKNDEYGVPVAQGGNYLVITVGKRLDNETAYTYTDVTPAFTKDGDVYKAKWEFTENADYTFDIKYTDKSLKVYDSYVMDEFTVDKNDPKVTVEFSEPAYSNVNQYREDRTATITIVEHNFDAKDVVATVVGKNASGIVQPVSFKDGEGHDVTDYAAYLSDNANWTASTTEADTYTATITFSTEVDFTFDIKYTDLAGNVFDSFDEVEFTVDKTAPTASIQVGTWTESIDGTKWTAFPAADKDSRAFGSLSTNEKVTVTINTADTLSGVDIVKHFRSDKILTLDEVKASTEWINVTENKNTFSYDVEPDEQFVVYVYVVDMAGNEHYVSSDGIILDKTLPTVEKIAPEIIIEPEADKQPINDIYNTDVDVDVKVIDPTEKGTYSGLKSITYNIYNVNIAGVETKTQEGTLFTFDKTSGNTLVNTYDEAACITVDRTKNNSNNVVIEVIATDNAGNTKTEKHTIQIDITAPVIDIAYDNNEVDSATYFDAIRKATIKISERNFKNEDVVITVTHTDDDGKETKTTVTPNFTVEKDGDTPKVYVFDGEGRDSSEYYVYTMEYTYDKDGDYKFEIEYADLASNQCTEKNFAEGTAAGTEYAFTLDMTKPVIKVTYDNNEVQNGNYYKADRVATIVITEHNLDPNGVDKERINITVTATDDGKEITAPVETKWTTNGNTHTATITYNADGLYNFDITVKDKAGNESLDYTAETFYVDKTNPAVSITEIVDQSANNDEGDIGFVITATDTNFDSFAPVLTVTDITGASKKLEVGTIGDITNGKTFTVKNLDADGIYRITCTVVDKAGNAFSEVTLQRADGSTYVENRDGDDTLVTFSVNRDGSTYEINANTADLIKKYYVQNVTDNVVIVETNADPLTEYKVTLNGKELTKDTDYTVTEEGGNGSWMKYTYSVNKELFADEGEYKIVVSSKDKAENDAFSDVKDATVNFVVDRTAPIVTITGLANDGRYQTDVQTVTLIPTDDGGALKSLIVRTVDEDGKQLKEILNLAGEELEKALADGAGKITFKIEKGLYQNVQIICDDCAVDEDGKTNVYDETIKNVSVDANAFIVNFWANKPLRWGSIAGVILLAAAIILFVFFKKRKKNEASK